MEAQTALTRLVHVRIMEREPTTHHTVANPSPYGGGTVLFPGIQVKTGYLRGIGVQ